MILVPNVRLSFPNIYVQPTYKGEKINFAATVLIPKSDVSTKKMLDDGLAALCAEKKINEAMFEKIQNGTLCLKDGDLRFDDEGRPYEGYAGHWSLKGSSRCAIPAYDRNKMPVSEEENNKKQIFYAGCYVNALVSFWYIKHEKGGLQINATMHGIQFVRDGTPFTSAPSKEQIRDGFSNLDSIDGKGIEDSFVTENDDLDI